MLWMFITQRSVLTFYILECYLEPSFDPKITGQNLGFLRCEVSDTSEGSEHDVSRWTQCSICCNSWGLSRGRNDVKPFFII